MSDTRIERLVLGGLDNNVWIIVDSGESLIIDASFEAASIAAKISETTSKGIAITHGHFDHINAADELRKQTNTPIYLHSEDKPLWRQQYSNAEPDHSLQDEEKLHAGDTHVRILHTPGHTPGSVCYYVETLNTVFTGDTLFPGGPGATRWDYSDFTQIIESIRTKLFTLPDNTQVLPGHGEPTTIGAEKPKLQEWIKRGW